MKKSITQELEYGCGVACFAFVCDLTFRDAVERLGREYSVKSGWRPSDLVNAFHDQGFYYKNTYVRKKLQPMTYPHGTIVLVERSTRYPVGHYLVFSESGWMDPWINLAESVDIADATSGFRRELPGRAMYALIPTKV